MYKIIETIKHYTKNGNRWKETDSTTKEIPEEYYRNATDPATVRFFRNLGGYERVERAYTFAGYVPVRIHSLDPSRTEKTLREYRFENVN